MALSVHTNYSSLVTQTNLSKTNKALSTSQQNLGTGFRVNTASDDAAGLQIATRLNAQSRGMGIAMRNTSDATSLLQTAEGAFSEVTEILQRMKDLATQSANGTNSAEDRKSLQAEYNELGAEMSNILSNTTYAGEALFSVDGAAGKFAAAVSFQIGATTAETLSLDVATSVSDVTTALSGLSASYTTAGAAGTEIEAGGDANTMIDDVTDALDLVSTLRAKFGATINRLDHTSNNLANMKDNTEMASGRIMDADFASESAAMSKNSMLLQSGISMLKQSNQMSSMVMSLIG
jgi:flagellin